MYPYESRLRWLFNSRYHHILQFLQLHHDRLGHDSLVLERAASLRRWGRTRAAVAVTLYLGILGTALSFASRYFGPVAATVPLLTTLVKITGTFTGILTLAFLFLTRLLSQIEGDILMLLSLKR
jgi:hypothetical protein